MVVTAISDTLVLARRQQCSQVSSPTAVIFAAEIKFTIYAKECPEKHGLRLQSAPFHFTVVKTKS